MIMQVRINNYRKCWRKRNLELISNIPKQEPHSIKKINENPRDWISVEVVPNPDDGDLTTRSTEYMLATVDIMNRLFKTV